MRLKEKLKKGRIVSIDAFRGVTILIMIFVNELSTKSNIPQWMKHMPADADAMSFVDIVFPAFLFIVGMSIPFSFNARLAKEESSIKIWMHTLKRTGALIIMGLFMVNAEFGYNKVEMLISPALWGFLAYILPIIVWNKYDTKMPGNLKRILQYGGLAGFVVLYFLYVQKSGSVGMTPKWWGILGLIGWAYLLTVLVYWSGKGKLWVLIGFLLLCIIGNSISQSGDLAINEFKWFRFISGHMVHSTMVVAGVIISLLFFEGRHRTYLNWSVIGFIVLFFVLGYILRPYFEVSKIRGTPSWTLYSSGFCTIAFYLLYVLMELKDVKGWANFIMPAASNPLLIYILPGIIIYFGLTFGLGIVPKYFQTGLPAVIWSLAFSILMLYIVSLLNRMKIQLHI